MSGLIIEGGSERAPSFLLRGAVEQRGPFPDHPHGVTWRVIPRLSYDLEKAPDPGNWYETVWSVQSVCDHGGPKPPRCGDWLWNELGPNPSDTHLLWHDIEHSERGTFGHPRRLTEEERLAQLEPVDENVFEEDVIRFLGGVEAARAMLENRRAVIARWDESAEAYDWGEFADRLIAHYRTLTAPKATQLHRVMDAAARRYLALAQVEYADQSLEARLRNMLRAQQLDLEDVASYSGLPREAIDRLAATLRPISFTKEGA